MLSASWTCWGFHLNAVLGESRCFYRLVSLKAFGRISSIRSNPLSLNMHFWEICGVFTYPATCWEGGALKVSLEKGFSSLLFLLERFLQLGASQARELQCLSRLNLVHYEKNEKNLLERSLCWRLGDVMSRHVGYKKMSSVQRDGSWNRQF